MFCTRSTPPQAGRADSLLPPRYIEQTPVPIGFKAQGFCIFTRLLSGALRLLILTKLLHPLQFPRKRNIINMDNHPQEEFMANQKKPIYEEENQPGSTLMKVIGALVCFGLAVLMVYLSLAEPQQGTAMVAIRNITRGIGGSLSVLLSLIFVWIGILFVFSARGRKLRIWRILMNALLFLCVFTGVHLFSAQEIIETRMMLTTFPNFISHSYQYGAGGGALGALLAYPLYTGIGSWGGLIVTILLALLSLTATGHTQKFVRWTRRNAENAKYRSDQRRKVKEQDRVFDYSEYDELEIQPQPRPRAQARRRAEDDYMIINSTPDPCSCAARPSLRPRPRPAARRSSTRRSSTAKPLWKSPPLNTRASWRSPSPCASCARAARKCRKMRRRSLQRRPAAQHASRAT